MVPLLVQLALAARWFAGGDYPFAVPVDSESNFGDHWLAGVDPGVVEWTVVVAGGLLALAVLRMQHQVGGALRGALLATGWGGSAFLVVVLPGTESLNNLPGLNLIHPRFSGPTFHLLTLMYGGLALAATTLAFQRVTRAACVRCGRGDGRPRWSRDSWATLGRWASWTAFVAPFGYAVIRLLWSFGVPVGATQEFLDSLNAANPGHVTRNLEWALAAMAIGGGVLCLGLTQRWGVVWPRWVVGLAGRPVPRALPIVAGTIAGQVLFAFGTALVPGLLRFASGETVLLPHTDVPTTWVSHVPELAIVTWGAAVLVAVVAYAYRTRPACRACGRDG